MAWNSNSTTLPIIYITYLIVTFLWLLLKIGSRCLFVFLGSTFNALPPSPLLTITSKSLFYRRLSLYPDFFINFLLFGLFFMPRTWKVENLHDTGFQRWILTTERFCGSWQYNCKDGEAAAAFFLPSSSKSLSCAEQLAPRSHASNAAPAIAWPRSFSRDLLLVGGVGIPMVSYAQVAFERRNSI